MVGRLGAAEEYGSHGVRDKRETIALGRLGMEDG